MNSYSATAAILDNGVDHTHSELEENIYRNLDERLNGYDDDQNGYIDDILGWNFVTMTNSTFDFSREIYLTTDIERYYHLRAKNSLGTITEEETREYNKLKKDSDLSDRRKDFVSWMHGTHVAGIAANSEDLPQEINSSDIKIFSVTYLGDAKSGPAKAPEFEALNTNSTFAGQRHLENYWKSFLKWQLNKFQLGVDYAASKASVVNGSFGQSFEGIQERMENYYKDQFGKEMNSKESFARTTTFMKELIEKSTRILSKHPNTLFVFSAGNKKNNSDEYIHFPSAIRLENSLSIGASFDFKEMAYFSNFGKKTVDLFAPGMAIRSTIPRQGYLATNGTSQASPYVVNIAIKALAQAERLGIKLKIYQLKNILLQTVIKKSELTDLSVSGGIIFPERVYQTVRNLRRFNLTNSIQYAIRKYPTKSVTVEKLNDNGLFLELPEN
ncbi:S8 family serine peptidase [Halobacteriovorax sp. JY17]|uniref:S8 family serine peptidase n=1 Tax=Halobacteriovorax sp. JY17 TaxID=2014617 RepID=UPI0025B817D7|nr:S8 family serine peptidase [Halobacteriovorax sp. JY17]